MLSKELYNSQELNVLVFNVKCSIELALLSQELYMKQELSVLIFNIGIVYKRLY